jgi:SEC-C motif-containing protein
MICYCCSSELFENCCKPLLLKERHAQTALELMRSRYSAYATGSIQYIIETTHHSTLNQYNPDDLQEWADENDWLKLEILSKKMGGVNDVKGSVEFKAHYMDLHHKKNVHHEYSTFVKENGRWYFVKGEIR